RAGEGLRHQVDGVGGRAGEDDLFAPAGIEELAHLGARALEGFGGTIGQRVQASVNIGIFVSIGMIHPLQNLHRLLRRSAAVKIVEAMAVDGFRQDRKIGADFFEIEGHQSSTEVASGHPSPRRGGVDMRYLPLSSQPSTTVLSAAFRASFSIGSSISAMKPRTSMVSASACGTPRLMR